MCIRDRLEPEKPLDVRLEELLTDQAVDIRALAARCLACLDQFQPLIKDLGNLQQKAFWAVEIDALHHGLSRSPATATVVKESAAAGRQKAKADAIYRLLWGYSAYQLADIGAAELVDALEAPDVEIRVLASDNLRRITGAMGGYRPEKRVDENKAAIIKWKDRLKDTSSTVSYTHLRAHETPEHLVCRLLL